ncbi:glycoside hydrolase family 16 protein [Apiospora marii]|uniref:Glycoside hydrolase family 16 protein n=1 Tax=Apiospora marii TaxID=335849 RepID=A0ABR1R578_9PEZI
MRTTSGLLSLLPALVGAIAPPNLEGLKLLWHDGFEGPAGSPPSNKWNIALSVNTNNELQTYSVSNQNIQISGGDTMQLVPRKSPSGHWTSGRIETKDSWTPPPGGKLLIQSSLLLGSNAPANQQGIWPAFWALGDAMRHGTQWPLAGELDIMERVSGSEVAYGTTHCGEFPGGVCNEPTGRGSTTPLPSNGFHTWALQIDVTNPDWRAQKIDWMLDGKVWRTLTGADIGVEGTWSTLAHSPLYILLNVAVGGDWPGNPNAATMDGYGSMMELQYVAVYST